MKSVETSYHFIALKWLSALKAKYSTTYILLTLTRIAVDKKYQLERHFKQNHAKIKFCQMVYFKKNKSKLNFFGCGIVKRPYWFLNRTAMIKMYKPNLQYFIIKRNTVTRRVEDMSNDINSHLAEMITKLKYFHLCDLWYDKYVTVRHSVLNSRFIEPLPVRTYKHRYEHIY